MGVKTIEEATKLKEVSEFGDEILETREDGVTVRKFVWRKVYAQYVEPDDLICWQEPDGRFFKSIMTEEGLCKTEFGGIF